MQILHQKNACHQTRAKHTRPIVVTFTRKWLVLFQHREGLEWFDGLSQALLFRMSWVRDQRLCRLERSSPRADSCV